MTTGVRILENDGRVQITASGGQTSLAFDFPIYDESHIRIIRTRSGVDTTLALTTDYTVPSGSVGVEAGGVVTLNTGAAVNDIYTLLLDVPYARTTDFIVAGDFLAETLNLELDLMAQQNQQIVRDQSLALRLPDSSTISATLPSAEAAKLLGWNGTATGLTNYAVADLSGSVVSSYAQTLLDDADAAAARVTLGIPYNPASSASASSLEFFEDTDNGTNKVTLVGPASIGSNSTLQLPGTGTLATLAGSETLTNKTIITTASSTGGAGFNVPHGTAPTSPVNGDVWSTTAGAFMQVNAVTLPMTGGFKVGTLSFNMTTATGSIVTTGVGFKPRALQLFSAINGTVAASFGFSDGTTQFYMYTNDGGVADNFAVSSTLIGTLQTGAGAFQQFSLTTFDNDGFTIANTKNGSPTGTATLGYIAYR